MNFRIAGLIIALALIGTVSAASISADVGETYIRWQWAKGSVYDVSIDGDIVQHNSTATYYYLTDLRPNEEHRLDLINTTDTTLSKSSVMRTNPQAGSVWLILGMTFILALITMFLTEQTKVILTAVLTAVLSIFGRSISYGYYGIDYVFLGFALFAGIWAILIFIKENREKLTWWQ